MHAFHIHYRNTQGTLMRILTAVSRRALEVQYLHAVPSGNTHRLLDLLVEVTPKQIGQLCRDWHAIVDVTDVRFGAPTQEMLESAAFAGPHPPASASGQSATAAMA